MRCVINVFFYRRNNHLESLDVSFNRIECLDSIENLRYLRELNAGKIAFHIN
jgi:Leucine-rich repeat (LRR) protein